MSTEADSGWRVVGIMNRVLLVKASGLTGGIIFSIGMAIGMAIRSPLGCQ
jgi:hypothetical protein